MKDLVLSLIQANLHWEEIDANLAMFEEHIGVAEDADLFVLPEMFTTGFSMEAKKLAEPPGGKTYKWMRQMAARKKAAIVGSYIVKDKGHFCNRLYFVRPDGSSEHYDKRHLFSLAGEEKVFTPGSERCIVNYKGWRIFPMICYDLRFPVWARSQQGDEDPYEYDLLLYTANWPEARIHAWDSLLQARAIENLSFCAGVNRVGMDGSGKHYPGHSALYDFAGNRSGYLKEQEPILTVKLEASALTSFRDRFGFQKDGDQFSLQ